MANATVEQLLIRIDATTEVLRRELKRADTSMAMFERQTMRSLKAVENQFKRFRMQMSGALAGVFSVYAVAGFTKGIVEASDAMTNMRAQLNLVSGSQERASSNFNKLFRIANKTGQSLNATVTIFTRMVRNTEALGVSQDELLRVTETLNKAFVISGTNSREASNAMIQLSQAFGKSKLDGEEFNAIAEQAPIVIQAIASEMGTTVGAMKQFAEEGKITTQVMLRAFDSLAKDVDRQFSQIPMTIQRAMQAVENIWTASIGNINVSGLTDSLVELQTVMTSPAFEKGIRAIAQGFIDALSVMGKVVGVVGENIEWLIGITKVLAAIYAGRLSQSIADATIKKLQNAAASTKAAASVQALAVAEKQQAIAALNTAQAETMKATAAARSAKTAADSLRSTKAQILAEIELENVRRASQITEQGRMDSRMRMVALQKNLVKTTKALGEAEKVEAAALASHANILIDNEKAHQRYRRAISRSSAAMVALAAVGNSLKSVLGFLGGPLGAIILAATALTFFKTESEKAKDELNKLGMAVDDYVRKLKELSRAELEQARATAIKNLEALTDQYNKIKKKMDEMSSSTLTFSGMQVDFTEGVRESNAELSELERKMKAAAEQLSNIARALDDVSTGRGGEGGFVSMAFIEEYLNMIGQLSDPTLTAWISAYVNGQQELSKESQKVVDGLYEELKALKSTEEQRMVDAALAKVSAEERKAMLPIITNLVKKILEEKAAIKALEKEQKRLIDSFENLKKRHEDANDAIQDGLDTIDKWRKVAKDGLRQQEEEIRLLGMSELARRQYLAVQQLGIGALEEEKQAARNLAEEQYKLEGAQKSAKESQEQWNEALTRTRERIDEAFANAWRGAFDSFKDFADSLKDAFKSLLAELAHIALTRPIVMSFASAMGLGSSGAMASGGLVPSGGGLMGALSAAGSGLTSFGGSAVGLFGQNAAYSFGMNTQALGQMFGMGSGLGTAITGGAGLFGSFLSNQVFGPTSGFGSAAGGIASTALLGPAAVAALGPLGLPLAAFGGSFLGGGIESLFGFGKNNGNNSGKAILNLATGQVESFGVGKSFDQANVDAATQITQAIQTLASALGVTTGQYEVQVGNRFGVKLDGKKVGDAGDALAAVLEDLLDKTGKLTPEIKKLIKAFDGTLEETVRFTMAIGTIADLSKRNPALEAMRDFKNSMELAGMTATQVYMEQVDAIGRMADAFDGSLESTEALSQALTINKQAAYDLTMILEQTEKQIKRTVMGNVEYYRQQTQTPDERAQFLEKRYNFFYDILEKATDPAQIQELADRLFSISRELFDMAPEDLKRSNVEFFIDRDKAIRDLAGDRLEEIGVSIIETQEDINGKVTAALNNASSQFQQSANTMQSAAQIFMEAVMYFTGNTQYQGEVTA